MSPVLEPGALLVHLAVVVVAKTDATTRSESPSPTTRPRYLRLRMQRPLMWSAVWIRPRLTQASLAPLPTALPPSDARGRRLQQRPAVYLCGVQTTATGCAW